MMRRRVYRDARGEFVLYASDLASWDGRSIGWRLEVAENGEGCCFLLPFTVHTKCRFSGRTIGDPVGVKVELFAEVDAFSGPTFLGEGIRVTIDACDTPRTTTEVWFIFVGEKF